MYQLARNTDSSLYNHHYFSNNLLGGGLMMFFWIIILAVLVYLGYFLISNQKQDNTKSDKSSVDILKTRYAKGEISEEEYDKASKKLKE